MRFTYYKVIFISLIFYAPAIYLLPTYLETISPIYFFGGIILFLLFFYVLRLIFVYDRKQPIKEYYIFKKMQIKAGRMQPFWLLFFSIFFFMMKIIFTLFALGTVLNNYIVFFDVFTFQEIVLIFEIILIIIYFALNRPSWNFKSILQNFILVIGIYFAIYLGLVIGYSFQGDFLNFSFQIFSSNFWNFFVVIFIGFGNYIFIVSLINDDPLNYKMFLSNRIVFLIIGWLITLYIIRFVSPVQFWYRNDIMLLGLLIVDGIFSVFMIRNLFVTGARLKIINRLSLRNTTNFILVNLMLFLPILVALDYWYNEIYYFGELILLSIFIYIFYRGLKISTYKKYSIFGLVITFAVIKNFMILDVYHILPFLIFVFINILIYKDKYTLKEYKPREIFITELNIIDENNNVLFLNYPTKRFSSFSRMPEFRTKNFNVEAKLTELGLEQRTFWIDSCSTTLTSDELYSVTKRIIYIGVKGVEPKIACKRAINHYWSDPRKMKIYDERYNKKVYLNEIKTG